LQDIIFLSAIAIPKNAIKNVEKGGILAVFVCGKKKDGKIFLKPKRVYVLPSNIVVLKIILFY